MSDRYEEIKQDWARVGMGISPLHVDWLISEVRRLRAERDDWKQKYCDAESNMVPAVQWDEVYRENRRLREALKKYGCHTPECPVISDHEEWKCCCEWTEVRRALQQGEGEQDE